MTYEDKNREDIDKAVELREDLCQFLEEVKQEVWDKIETTFGKTYFSPVSIQRVKDSINSAIDFMEDIEIRTDGANDV